MKNRPYSPDEYFSRLYETGASPFDGAQSADDVLSVSQSVREKLGKIFAIDKIPYKTGTLSPVTVKKVKRDGYTVETLSTEICKGLNMLSYVLIPEKASGMGVAALCGHGYGARQIIRQSKGGNYRYIDFIDNYQKNFALALCREGHTVIVPEFIGFGEAKLKKDSLKPFYSSSCDTLSHHSLLFGFSLASLRIYQTVRCIDILREKYGCEKTGCMGISGGGLVALYTSCLDERIEKTCVCGYINTFRTSVLSMWHCPDNYIPSLAEAGDMYDFASALVPKKLMMQCGTRDRLFRIDGSLSAVDKIRSVYEKAGAGDCFTPVVFDGKHEVSLKEALGFFREE